MNYEKYLPIGTVVLLENGQKKVMITGFGIIDNTDEHKIWDYSGCLYPEGIISSNKTLLFDHNQIKNVYFLGYQDDEEQQFKTKLKDVLANVNKN